MKNGNKGEIERGLKGTYESEDELEEEREKMVAEWVD